MDEHFRAFSFVDRIHSHQPGVRISASYVIPDGVGAFPVALVAEAVGQLAAWAAMAAVDFKCRPVAGLAGDTEILSSVKPGQILNMEAALECVDTEAVAYEGTARVNGMTVIKLQNCVGPMLPIEEFDEPQALRDRFALLTGEGAAPGAFKGLPALPLEHKHGEPGQSLGATLRVPASAPFFADHFPHRPVFPGTLLMDANFELALSLARQWPAPLVDGCWALRAVSRMKLRAFTLPGETLEIGVRLDQMSADAAIVSVESRNGKRVIGGARVRFVPEESR